MTQAKPPDSLYPTISQTIGNTPLVRLQRIPGVENERRGNLILGKLEGNNPAGSVKDRPALSMILHAQERGVIKPGDTLIEATSGNTGIAIAMVGAMLGYKIILVMPENQSLERRQSMAAYGAELILTSSSGGMELARDYAEQLQKEGRGKLLDQFANPDNPRAHIETTGPEIWRDTHGAITHFVSAMGTTGTKREGVDVALFQSRRLTEEMIKDSDLILVMAAHHMDDIIKRVPHAASKTHMLRQYARRDDSLACEDMDISDPIGKPMEVYEQTLAEIKKEVNRIAQTL